MMQSLPCLSCCQQQLHVVHLKRPNDNICAAIAQLPEQQRWDCVCNLQCTSLTSVGKDKANCSISPAKPWPFDQEPLCSYI